MPYQHFEGDWRDAQKRIMGGVYYRAASDVQNRLAVEIRAVAAAHRGTVWGVILPPGPKGKDEATTKVDRDYGGDWSRIKDLARCTLVVGKNEGEVAEGLRAVRSHFQTRNGFVVIEEKATMGFLNDCGYSGDTVFVQTGGGDSSKGEIQVNTPAMMYGKDLRQFQQLEKQGVASVSQMIATYGAVKGGLGHALYETARNDKEGDSKRRVYARACKFYYNYFRSSPPNMNWGFMARDAVRALNDPHLIV
jgi:hypothetical protein